MSLNDWQPQNARRALKELHQSTKAHENKHCAVRRALNRDAGTQRKETLYKDIR